MRKLVRVKLRQFPHLNMVVFDKKSSVRVENLARN